LEWPAGWAKDDTPEKHQQRMVTRRGKQLSHEQEYDTIVVMYKGEWSVAEIARFLQRPETTINGIINRAVKRGEIEAKRPSGDGIRGRSRKGDELLEEQITKVCELYDTGMSYREIAQVMGWKTADSAARRHKLAGSPNRRTVAEQQRIAYAKSGRRTARRSVRPRGDKGRFVAG
jgi:IS30 family transposase